MVGVLFGSFLILLVLGVPIAFAIGLGSLIPILLPIAFHSFGGWKTSLFGDHHMHGPRACASTPASRRSRRAGRPASAPTPEFMMPTMG